MVGRDGTQRQGLLVGLGVPVRSRVRAALSALSMPVVDAIDLGAASELVGRVRFDSVVVGYPLPDAPLAALLDAVRRPSSSSRMSALVLIAGAERRREAEAFLGLGANRVVPLEDVEPELSTVLDRLSRVARRRQIAAPSRIEFRVGNVAKRLFGQTVNISASGMLVRLPHRLAVGSEVGFELFFGGDLKPVRGRGNVVRQTLQQREPFPGVGVAFTWLAEADSARLADNVPGGDESLGPEEPNRHADH